MQRVVWYELVFLASGFVTFLVSVVQFVRPDGDGLPFGFATAGLLLIAGASMLVRRWSELPPVSWYEIVLIILAGVALVLSIVEFAKAGGDASIPYSLATLVLVLIAIASRLVRSRVPAR